MPVNLSVHPERRLAYFRMRGRLDTATCAAIFAEYVHSPEFDPAYPLLGDTTELESVDTGFIEILTQVMRLRSALARLDDRSRVVIHARTETLFGLARMLQQTVQSVTGLHYEISMDEAEALDHAGQPERDFLALRVALGLAEDHDGPSARVAPKPGGS